MGCWSDCLWGDDDAIDMMEFVLLLSGHPIPPELACFIPISEEEHNAKEGRTAESNCRLPDGTPFRTSFSILQLFSPKGLALVCRHSPEQYAAIYHGIDQLLTAEDMNSLSSPMPVFLANFAQVTDACCRPEARDSAINMTAARWAFLCMHVGAEVPAALKLCAYLAVEKKGGFFANTPGRQAVSEIAIKEVSLYSAGLPLRFERETAYDILENEGFSRFAPPLFFTRNDVMHSCATCRKMDSPRQRCAFQICSLCHMRFYCSSACQKLHWKAEHKHECLGLKEGRIKTAAQLRDRILASPKEKFDLAQFVMSAPQPRETMMFLSELLPAKKKGKKKQK